MSVSDERVAWVQAQLGGEEIASFKPLLTEASQRQFYRVKTAGDSLVLMDAGSESSSISFFIEMSALLRRNDINAPKIIANSESAGWVLMSDLGDDMYSEVLQDSTMSKLYRQAIDALIKIHLTPRGTLSTVPNFDSSFIASELGYFDEWFMGRHLQHTLNTQEQEALSLVYQVIQSELAAQPQVLLHRDYHSRNLLCTKTCSPGVVDIQDAVIGPLVYDLVSLLRDAYVSWPMDSLRPLIQYFQIQAEQHDLLAAMPAKEFMRWFEWTAMQRHLKVIGIFCRLYYRDDKSQYLQHLPRLIQYLKQAAANYKDALPLYHLICDVVEPRLVVLGTHSIAQTG